MILFCFGYGYCPHYNAKNDQRKRIVPKTLSRVKWLENGTVWKRCFPSVHGENNAIYLKMMTSPQHHHHEYTRLADRHFQRASLLIAVIFRRGALGSSRKYPYPYHGWHFGIPNAWGGGFFGLEFQMHGGVAGMHEGVSSPGILKGGGG